MVSKQLRRMVEIDSEAVGSSRSPQTRSDRAERINLVFISLCDLAGSSNPRHCISEGGCMGQEVRPVTERHWRTDPPSWSIHPPSKIQWPGLDDPAWPHKDMNTKLVDSALSDRACGDGSFRIDFAHSTKLLRWMARHLRNSSVLSTDAPAHQPPFIPTTASHLVLQLAPQLLLSRGLSH